MLTLADPLNSLGIIGEKYKIYYFPYNFHFITGIV